MKKDKYSNTSCFDEEVSQPPLLRYETSISLSTFCDESSSSGTTSSSTRISYDDERSISLMSAEYSVNALLECLSQNRFQHESMDTSSSSLIDDLDYLHILTMAHNHVKNLLISKDVSVSTKKVLTDALLTAWKDLNQFLALQHQISYKTYHTLRRELQVNESSLYEQPIQDHFVHPNVYTKIKMIQKQKAYKALCFMNEVSELYCSSLKGLALTQNLMTKYQLS